MYRQAKYAVISPNTYSEGNNPYKLVYAATGPRLFAIPLKVADGIANNDVSHLSSKVIQSLVACGLLRSDSPSHETAEIQKYLQQESRDESHRSFILMPTSMCNMCCAYCGQNTCPLHFSKTTDLNVSDRVISAITSPTVKRVDVRWYGGEPMLAYRHILALSQKYVSAARDTGTEYFSIISTNGSLVTYNRLKDLYEQAALRAVNVTIDGYGECHDDSRKMRTGKPTYQRIMGWLQEASLPENILPDLEFLIRVNVTSDNAESIPKLLNDIADRNIHKGRMHLQFMPVYDWGHDNSEYKLKQDLLDTIMVQWLALAVKLGIPTNLFPQHRTTVLCPAVSRQEEVIDSNGNLFNCTEFPLVEQYEKRNVLGNILDVRKDELRPRNRFDSWNDNILKNGSPCSDCVFLPVCGGSCPKRWEEKNKPCPAFTRQISGRFDVLANKLGFVKEP